MSTLRAVDASYDQLTTDEVGCFVRQNIDLFVQCLWTGAEQPAPRITNLRLAYQGGLWLAGYISLTRSQTGIWHVNHGRRNVPDDLWREMRFVAIDIELDGIRIDEIVAACDRVVSLGQRPILYTNYNSWMTKVVPANPSDIAQRGILLWNSYWDQDPDIDFPRLPFGGWRPDQVIIEQWSGGTDVCGAFVDRNTVVRELLLGDDNEQIDDGGEDMPDEVARQHLADLKQVVAEQRERIDVLEGIVTDVKTLLSDTNEEVDSLLAKAHEPGDDSAGGVRAALSNHKSNPNAHAEVLANHASDPDAHRA